MKGCEAVDLRELPGRLALVGDAHLGADLPGCSSAYRERLLLDMLEWIGSEIDCLVLVGDMLDFGFVWRRVVPRVGQGLLEGLRRVADLGVRVYWVAGNHDQWLDGAYLREWGVVWVLDRLVLPCRWGVLYVEHGDVPLMRGVGDRLVHWLFRNRVLRGVFRGCVHPDVAVWLAGRWSRASRLANSGVSVRVLDRLKNRLVGYAQGVVRRYSGVRLCVFGHIHYGFVERVDGLWVASPGDWLRSFSWLQVYECGTPYLFRWECGLQRRGIDGGSCSSCVDFGESEG